MEKEKDKNKGEEQTPETKEINWKEKYLEAMKKNKELMTNNDELTVKNAELDSKVTEITLENKHYKAKFEENSETDADSDKINSEEDSQQEDVDSDETPESIAMSLAK